MDTQRKSANTLFFVISTSSESARRNPFANGIRMSGSIGIPPIRFAQSMLRAAPLKLVPSEPLCGDEGAAQGASSE